MQGTTTDARRQAALREWLGGFGTMRYYSADLSANEQERDAGAMCAHHNRQARRCRQARKATRAEVAQ